MDFEDSYQIFNLWKTLIQLFVKSGERDTESNTNSIQNSLHESITKTEPFKKPLYKENLYIKDNILHLKNSAFLVIFIDRFSFYEVKISQILLHKLSPTLTTLVPSCWGGCWLAALGSCDCPCWCVGSPCCWCCGMTPEWVGGEGAADPWVLLFVELKLIMLARSGDFTIFSALFSPAKSVNLVIIFN